MRTETKLRTDPPINARDFGVPAEFAERAESYARWAVAQEREACAQLVAKRGLIGTSELASAIRDRS